ncbi:MAG: HPr family phosphocarrier protein [Pseudomonadota bacterium]|nr:HPr family phosphocarrier protein [Pseudomonadota bacterium]
MFEKHVTIENKRGLHARAAARFAQLAEQFDSEINVEVAGLKVSAQSIMGLMMLGAGKGVEILITAEGVDAKESLKALEELIKNRFDEE